MDHAENEQNVKRKSNHIGRFIAAVVFTIMLAAGWFLLWAYISYELRLSAEVIRVGLVLLYVIPCWFGGKVVRRCMPHNAGFCGAGLGVVLYALILGLHAAEGEAVRLEQTQLVNLVLCVLSGIGGTLRFRGHRPEKK